MLKKVVPLYFKGLKQDYQHLYFTAQSSHSSSVLMEHCTQKTLCLCWKPLKVRKTAHTVYTGIVGLIAARGTLVFHVILC
jgi:hypothetical protein